MKLRKLHAEIRRIEAELKRMYAHARNLEMTATIPPFDIFCNEHLDLTPAARERAMVLFWQHLSPDQRSEFTRQKWFTAKAKSGTEYRINRTRVGRMVGGRHFVRLYCLVMAREIMPAADQMLAKKIIIEKDEGLFLRTAVDQGLHSARDFGFSIRR